MIARRLSVRHSSEAPRPKKKRTTDTASKIAMQAADESVTRTSQRGQLRAGSDVAMLMAQPPCCIHVQLHSSRQFTTTGIPGETAVYRERGYRRADGRCCRQRLG